jgi:MFS family permease
MIYPGDANRRNMKIMPYWTRAVALFFMGWVLIYATRNILSASMGAIQEEFGLTLPQLGLINSVFFFTYTLIQIPSGMMGDRFGLRRILVIGFLVFGVFTGLTGAATSFSMLILMRALTGIGQGAYYGPQYALSSSAIPIEHRGLGSAIINSGMSFGISLGLIGAGCIVNTLGLNWRHCFSIFAVPAVIIGILARFLIREDRPADNVNAEEETAAPPAEEKKHRRNVAAVYVMVFCSLFGFFIVQTWLPYYLQNERGIAAGRAGFVSSLVAWASIPGALFFSGMSDKTRRRKPFIVLLTALAFLSIIGCARFRSYGLMILCLVMYGLTGKLALDPILAAAVADNCPSRSRGIIFSTYNFVGMSSSILAPYIAGILSESTGSLASAFSLSGGLLLVGLIAVLSFFTDVNN